MRPGITGLWQSEARDNPSFSAYRRLDLFYVDNWWLGLDLAILANTAHAVAVRALKAILPRAAAERPAPHRRDLKVHALTIPELAGAESVSSGMRTQTKAASSSSSRTSRFPSTGGSGWSAGP